MPVLTARQGLVLLSLPACANVASAACNSTPNQAQNLNYPTPAWPGLCLKQSQVSSFPHETGSCIGKVWKEQVLVPPSTWPCSCPCHPELGKACRSCGMALEGHGHAEGELGARGESKPKEQNKHMPGFPLSGNPCVVPVPGCWLCCP